QVQIGNRDAHRVRRLCDDRSPRIDDHAATVTGPARVVVTDLGSGHHVALVLDRARPQQYLPVVTTGMHHKGRRHDQDIRARDGETLVEFREAQVIADRQAELYVFDWCDDRLHTRRHGARLVVGDATGDLHVVQMDLSIDGGERTVAPEQQRGVVGSLRIRADLMERAGVYPYLQLAGRITEERGELAVDRLRLRCGGGRTKVVDVLRQHGKIHAGRSGTVQQRSRHAQVPFPVVTRVQLTDGHPHGGEA